MIKYLLCVFAVLTFGDSQKCDDGYTLIRGSCFLPYNYLKSSWSGAQQLCSLDGGTLAIIDDCELYGDLVRFFHVSGYESKTGYWIGATDMEVEGKWKWTNGKDLLTNIPFWGLENDVEEPSGGLSENCAQLSAADRYSFHDENCDTGSNFLCQKAPLFEKAALVGYSDGVNNDEDLRIEDGSPKSGNCSDGFISIRDSCFFFQLEFPLSMQDGIQFCESLSSTLPILKDCNLYFDLVSYMSNNPEVDNIYYIGATDVREEGLWSWMDFTPVTRGPPFWGTYNGIPQPGGGSGQNCAYMSGIQNNRFNDDECYGALYTLCQKDPF